MDIENNAPDLAQLRTDFDRDGYIAVRPLFDTKVMAKINRELDRYIVDCVPQMQTAEVYYEDKADRATLKQLQNMHKYDDYFRQLFETDIIRDMAAAALGEPVDPVNLQYFNKPAGVGKPTPPHQDGYYFHLTPPKAVTGWLALEPVDDENGCIHYVRGSHRADNFRDHGRSGVLGFSQGMTDFGTEDDEANTVSFPGEEGTFLLHDSKTIHWAGANRSNNRSRRALGFIYFAQSAKVNEATKQSYKEKLERELRASEKI